MTDFLKAALDYAELGWHVFPLMPGQKIPITTHGVKDATTDKQQITEWWNKWPNANVAVACGERSGVYVVDVDISATGDVCGIHSLKEFPVLPVTIRQNTPRGGFHAFFKTGTSPANRNSFRPGIDIRGNGYYVVIAPSIHPNGGKYEWMKGCSPWDCLPAEYPDFMRPVVKTPWAAPVALVSPVARQCESDVMRRASAYLAACEPAIQGQAGHDKLLYAASRMVHGFLLTDSQAYDILIKEYNPRCIPPWDLTDQKDEKDFRRKVSEARKLQPNNPEGWLLNDDSYNNNNSSDCGIDIDVASLLSGKNKVSTLPVTSEYPQTKSELQFLCQPTGLLGEITSWLNITSLREQPFLSLASALTFLGALFGRKIRDTLGSRTNLYCMGVAPSSAGKQHALNQIRNLCSATGCTDLLGGDYIASDSAIEERMSRLPTTLFLWDEIGHLLAHIRKGASHNHAQVVSLLMKLYSSAGSMYLGREYAEKERQRTIVQPCCCIYGTSTPERFTSGISPEELQDGWLSRCLVFNSSSNPAKNRNTNYSVEIPDSITKQVKQWHEFTPEKTVGSELGKFVDPNFREQPPSQFVVPSTSDSERIFIRFDDETTEYGKGHPQLACLWSKGEENARKIALVVAAGESFENPVITPSIADYACRLIRYLLISFGKEIAPEIASSEVEKNKRKVYSIIKTAGIKGITLQHITKATRWSYQKGRRDILDDLFAAGDIAIEPVGKSISYWTIENYVEYMKTK